METIGRYRIVKKLGSGGMGEVYLAEDPKLDRMVAIKVLKAEFVSDPVRLSRFTKEAKAASALDNVGVAHIYEIGESDGVHFIAMQYVEGQMLSERIHNRPLPVSEILDMAIQIADALDEAHTKGIIHRDIKPQNLMITSRGQVKILDFGIAKTARREHGKSTSGATDTGVVLGTIYYMSPEQALGKEIDHRSDIFSVGVVLYEMSTGQLPFQGLTPVDTLQKILNDQPIAIPRYNPNIPHELERIILKCLEKDQERRYQSVRDLLVDLKNLKIDTESGRVTAPLQSFRSRTRSMQLTSIALVVVAVVGLFIAVFPRNSQKIRSLAVLPVKNDNSDQRYDYLSDGFTDSFINTLSQIPELRVLSRGTVFNYKGKEVDPRKAGRELNVDAIVTGRLLKEGDDLQMTISLVRTSDGTQIWGEQYNRKTSDMLALQSQISREISEHLPQKVPSVTRQQMNKEPTQNVEAYELYLKGRFFLNKRTREDFQRAIQSFQEALILDSNYALARAGLADGFILLCNWGFLPPKSGFPKAKEEAQTALSIDPNLAEAYTSLAYVTSYYEWEWNEAEKNYQKAISLNPNYSTARQWYSLFLTIRGRHEEALNEIRAAQRLDPLSLIINANVGFSYYYSRRYDEAIQELQKTVDLDPNFALAHQLLGYVYGLKGDLSQSVTELQKAVDLGPDNLGFEADLAWAYAISGEREKATESLDGLNRISITTYVPPFHMAAAYAGLKQNDLALEWLEKAFEDRADEITYIAMDPRLDSLRNEPRFHNLKAKVGLQ